jgi:VWFA-related protein
MLRRTLPVSVFVLSVFTAAGVFFARPLLSQATASPAPQFPGAVAGSGQGQGLPQGPGQGESANITTIRTYSNLVVIDVVVSDSKQNAVHGLTADSFTLTENGKPQTIKHFEEHTAMPPAETAKLAPGPKLPPGLFTNQTPTPANGPVNVLLLDYLNTPLASQPYARQQLIDFLNKAPAGTRIAIFGLTSSLTMLQSFTSDPEILKNALTKKKGAPQASEILNDSVNGGPQTNTTLSDNFKSDALDAQQELANIDRFQALQTAFEQDMRSKFTLNAFNLLARYLVGIPGRKNLIWFSGSFPLSVEPQVGLQDAFDSVVRNDEEVRKTDNLLTRAQIAVYPVDARGLFNNPANSAINGASFNSAGNGGLSLTGDGGSPVGPVITPVSAAASDANSQMDFLQQTAQEHETMQEMAEDTGGHAFINTNNLTQAVAKAIENGSNYYTLTYTPSNSQWDGKFRAIKIKVDQPGVKLSYRNGYYADDPNDRNRNIAATAATVLARPTTMSTAMMRGGPDPTEILLRVRVRPGAEPPADDPVKDNQVNPDPKVKAAGPYKYYGVDVVPDRREISCPADANGNHRCSVEMATYVSDRDGQLIVKADKRLNGSLSPTNYAEMLKTGMAFHQEISVPVKGEYYIRTAVHDLTSDRVGAVEVPVASVARLQPLEVPPAADPPAGTVVPGAAPSTAPGSAGTFILPGAESAPGAGPAAPAAPATTPVAPPR